MYSKKAGLKRVWITWIRDSEEELAYFRLLAELIRR